MQTVKKAVRAIFKAGEILTISFGLFACGGGGATLNTTTVANTTNTTATSNNTSNTAPVAPTTNAEPASVDETTPAAVPTPAPKPAPVPVPVPVPVPTVTPPVSTPKPPVTPPATPPVVVSPNKLFMQQAAAHMSTTRTNEALPKSSASWAWLKNSLISNVVPLGVELGSYGNSYPGWWNSALAWFIIMEGQGNKATNSRLHIANLRLFVLSESTRTWRQVDKEMSPFIESILDPIQEQFKQPATYRKELDGSVSVKPFFPEWAHGWGHKVLIDGADQRAILAVVDFWLEVDNPKLPDDRHNAVYLVGAGVDYYPNQNVGPSQLGGIVPAAGNGRLLKATAQKRSASVLVPNSYRGASFTELLDNPAPVQ